MAAVSETFHGPNLGYVLELYERFTRDPASVDDATREFFQSWRPPADATPSASAADVARVMGAVNLAQAIRSLGHLAARLDPLGNAPTGEPSLEAAFHGLAEADLAALPAGLLGGPVAAGAATALEGIAALRSIYASTTGYEYDHIHDPLERTWLRDAAETRAFRPPHDPIDGVALLERLTKVEVFEQFLHRQFPGRTRFSIEGLDIMIPMLDEVIGAAAAAGICMVFIGMGHRGHLSVLANVLQKPIAAILAEFADPHRSHREGDQFGWTGDVKYHKGARKAVEGGERVRLVISMPSAPSHLEHIDPVVEGMARAADTKADRPGEPLLFPNAALPILIHGDASLPGQGIAAETLNLSHLPGYQTGGTVHIVANNQLGYTAGESETRSGSYASDLAKGYKIPIIHVNADDPEACIEAARTAFAYRQEFKKDFFVDLVGYRRYGHNEGDEPSFTQPLLYREIESHPTVRAQWASALLARGLIDAALANALIRSGMEALRQALETLEPERSLIEPLPEAPPPGAARHASTTVPLEALRGLNESLLRRPQGFHVHRKLVRAMARREHVLDDPDQPTIDWATAEELACASILADGIPIRFTGEDVIRGTFSQRHAAFYDTENGAGSIPLQGIPQARASYEIRNSPVTETASVAFEFGYNVQAPERLAIWEAQYGDFINVAQVIIDEFIVSARAKWGMTPSLVLLLPHGNEGQGPDHSSARPERWLEMTAETNLRLAIPTTAAQYFHLLRRQAALLKTDPLPLVVFTPKGLLRHPMTASTPRSLAEGAWQPVVDDPFANEAATHLVLTAGRLGVDLAGSERRQGMPWVALARLEQLYPFPGEEVAALLGRYPSLKGVIWAQEEPENMGAWASLRPRLATLLVGKTSLEHVSRPPSSSPAEGSAAWHAANQRALVESVWEHCPAPVRRRAVVGRG
jgi:2-oxoglutarate dehydrogenase E1 component